MLTLVIPVRWRQSTLYRALEYYKDFPGPVIVIDASPKPFEGISDYPYVDYRHIPEKPWMEFMYETLKSVDTKYVVKMCDDDFLPLYSIPQQLSFLETHPDYVSVMGQEVSLHENKLGYETLEYIAEVSGETGFDEDDKIKRLIKTWRYFNCKIHSIARTDAQLKVYTAMVEHPHLYATKYFDKVWSFMMASMGKLGVIHVVSLVRSREALTQAIAYMDETKKVTGNENKTHLTFRNDFLNTDLSYLLEFAGIDMETMRSMHKDLVEEEYKKDMFFNTLRKHELDCENSVCHGWKNNKTGEYSATKPDVVIQKNEGCVDWELVFEFRHVLSLAGQYQLIPRYGPAENYEWYHLYKKVKPVDSDGWFWGDPPTLSEREMIYPVYNNFASLDLGRIVKFVKENPLEVTVVETT